jgi:hypothetical protein
MQPKDIIIYAQKKLRSAEVLEVIDEINNFFRDDWLNVRYSYRYDIKTLYSGTADASQAVLSDTGASFATDGTLIGQTITNGTTGAIGTITAVTATTITAPLSGTVEWSNGDPYTILLTNNIHIPKNINRVISVYHGTERIFGSLSDISLLNSTGEIKDPYADNPYIPSPTVQGVVVRDDYVLSFVDDIATTSDITLICEKIIDEITSDDITTDMDIPDKFTMPISIYVLKELYDYEKYYDRQKKTDYEERFLKIMESAKKSVAVERSDNIIRENTPKPLIEGIEVLTPIDVPQFERNNMENLG